MVRSVRRRRHLLDAAHSRSTRWAHAHFAILRGPAAAQAANRTSQKSAVVFSGTAELLSAHSAGAERRTPRCANERIRRAHSVHLHRITAGLAAPLRLPCVALPGAGRRAT